MAGNSVEYVDKMSSCSRRFIKTHLPWHLLPEQLKGHSDAKIVYTMRNPKDQLVSYYHYCLLAHKMECTFEDFIELFFENKMVYGPSSQHMLEYFKRRHKPNVLIVKYEDMKRDLPTVIRQCADHLEINRQLTTDDIDKLCEYVKFERMEKNPSVNLEPLVFKDPHQGAHRSGAVQQGEVHPKRPGR